MATACIDAARPRLSRAIDPFARGYLALYRWGETNHCPGCGRTHWIIGRISAECAFCATALPLGEQDRRPTPTIWTRGQD